ncbi:MAG TPA: hypothetical protein VIL17_02935 [Coriobacteriia bacterium]
MFVQLTRFVMATLGALAGLSVKDLIDWNQQIGYSIPTVIILFVILGASIGFIFGGMIGREVQRTYLFFEDYLRSVSVSDLILGVFGLLVGLVIALILSIPVRSLQPPVVGLLGQVGFYFVFAYLGVRVALIKRRDVGRLMSRFFPGSGEPEMLSTKILDTSAIIDGRFAELLRAGFIEGAVRVPGFVLVELQTLADSADDLRRARGRRGLDLLASLRGGEHAVEVFSVDYPETPDVDGKLARLARDTDTTIVTVDHNLTQVARVQGLRVLNINDLAAALKPSHLPGEIIHLAVSREGKESDQGVGYLADGTMVVVHDGRKLVGEDVDVVVTSVLQTASGRMIFARPKAGL